MPAQIIQLLFRLIQRDFLDKHRLRQDVKRIRACSDLAPDQLIRLPINLWRGSPPNPVGHLLQ